MQTRKQALEKLSRSRFRSRFYLSEADKAYIRKVGMETIRTHAVRFVAERLSPAEPLHDGKQTPMRGHPVFIAQHATACCCRKCLQKWYRVPMHMPLSALQQEKIVGLILAWLQMEMEEKQNTEDK